MWYIYICGAGTWNDAARAGSYDYPCISACHTYKHTCMDICVQTHMYGHMRIHIFGARCVTQRKRARRHVHVCVWYTCAYTCLRVYSCVYSIQNARLLLQCVAVVVCCCCSVLLYVAVHCSVYSCVYSIQSARFTE